MIIMLRNTLVLMSFAITLAGCGGGGGGGDEAPASAPPPPPSTPPPSNTPPATISDVTIDKLAGSWFGTFDRKGSVVSIKFTVSANGGAITLDEVDGQASDLAGTVTKDGLTSFRFTLSNPGNTVQNQGVLITDQAAAYMLFISDAPSDREFAVLQKNGAAPLQSHTQTDVNGAWNGHTSAVGASLTNLQPKGSAADCAPAAASAPAGASACKATLSDRSRSILSFTLSDPLGRWEDPNYTDTVSGGPTQNGTTQAYISQDKKFIGVWACTSSASFPANCDYSAWTKR